VRRKRGCELKRGLYLKQGIRTLTGNIETETETEGEREKEALVGP
jgi:hypothetical protein